MAEIYIYDVIGQGFMEEGVTPGLIRDQLKEAGGEDVLVRINSPGGIVFDGIAIKSLLDAYPGEVNVQVDGLAASAASVIAMAGKKISMAEGSMLMIHDPWGLTIGNEQDHTEAALTLGKIAGNLAEMYAARGEKTADQFRDLMRAETWLTGAESIEMGLADALETTIAAMACTVPAEFGYRNVPTKLPGGEPPKAQHATRVELSHLARQRKIDLTKAAMRR